MQNVLEHAVIPSRDDWLYPEVALDEAPKPRDSTALGAEPPVMTAEEVRNVQRDNIRRALDACDWQISGDQGAARMLKLKPSTLRSQMQALNIQQRNP